MNHNVSAAPGELGTALQFGENVGHETSMPSIAISEWMDEDESMMKANRSLVGRERGVLDSVARVSDEYFQLLSNLMMRQANVLLARAILTSPFPRLIEHPLMQ